MIEHAHPRVRTSSRRAVARDTLIILATTLSAIAVAQLASGGSIGPQFTPQPIDSGVVVGADSAGPALTQPPIPTIGQVVNGSAGLDATPTPIPIITLAPPTPTPSPGPSAKPTPKPSAKPSAKPSPTPPPAPVAGFACTPVGLVLTCTDSSTHAVSWDWDWGDSQAHDTIATPPPHTYAAEGCYVVTLTVQNAAGAADSLSRTYGMFLSTGNVCP